MEWDLFEVLRILNVFVEFWVENIIIFILFVFDEILLVNICLELVVMILLRVLKLICNWFSISLVFCNV